jgi:hypothetical protein
MSENIFEHCILKVQKMSPSELSEMACRFGKSKKRFYSDIERIVDDFNKTYHGNYCYVIAPAEVAGALEPFNNRIRKVNLQKNNDLDGPAAQSVFWTARKKGISLYDHLLKEGYIDG